MVSGAGALFLLPLLLLAEPAVKPTAQPKDCEDGPPGLAIESPHDAAAMAEWLTAVRHRVHAKWVVPRSVREGEAGTVVLRFVVGRRGRLGGLETLCATGDRLLEKASRRAVKAATPLPPLPDAFEGDSLTASWRSHYQRRQEIPSDEEYPAESWVR